MPQPRFRATAKRSKDKNRLGPAFLWVAGLFVSLWLTWAVLAPSQSGRLGAYVSGGLFKLWGAAAYLVPTLLGYALALYFLPERRFSRTVLVIGGLTSLLSFAALVALVGRWADRPGWGGSAGQAATSALVRILGQPGAFFASMGGLLVGLQLYFDIAWRDVFERAWSAIREDTRAWLEARKKLAEDVKTAREAPPIIKMPVTGAESEAGALLPAGRQGAPSESENTNGESPFNGTAADEASKPKGVRLSEILAGGKKAEPKSAAKAAAPRTKWELPPLSLLKAAETTASGGRPSDDQVAHAAATLEKTLANFQIEAKVTGVSPGPVITRYELAPAPGVKVSSIVSLSNDLALALKAKSIRVIAPIPGKAAVGIEIPNPSPAKVTLREILDSPAFHPRQRLPFALGRKADGEPIVADIASMPHLLVAGATNSGKSVLIHDLILSLLYRSRPDELKFLLIDPKRLELTFYEGIPHLYDPRTADYDVHVLTDPKEAAKSLRKLVKVMELRYEKFAKYGVRNIDGFNEEAAKRGEPPEFYIVVVIDELADLMLTASEMVEDLIQRLAQMARAVGIHLVLSTQRPSVDVLTGVIKANLPTRVALQVISKVDSRVILDTPGAEALLGQGDLLYLASGAQKPVRAQAPYVSETEIRQVAEFWRSQGKPAYPPLEPPDQTGLPEDGKGANVQELVAALKLVQERRRVSQDLLKAHFGSSAKATDLLSILEVRGFIHKPEGTNRWEISYDKVDEYLKSVRPPGV